MAPAASSNAALRRMTGQARRDTGPELNLRRVLYKRGLRYRVQAAVVPGTRRTVDVAFPTARVAVDVRGCFWHSCPAHGSAANANAAWWAAKLAANLSRDADTEGRLARAGWALVVVWEHESTDRAADRIEACLDATRQASG